MSKLNFILLFLILIQNTLSISNSTDSGEIVYEYLKDFYAGMSDDEDKSKCLKVITDKKDYLIENIRPIIESIGDGNLLFKRLLTFGVNILTIHGFAKNCKILNVIIFYNKLTIKSEILNLGDLIINNKNNISGVFNLTSSDSFLKKMGKLAKIILNIRVK